MIRENEHQSICSRGFCEPAAFSLRTGLRDSPGIFCTITGIRRVGVTAGKYTVFVTDGTSVDLVGKDGHTVTLTFEET